MPLNSFNCDVAGGKMSTYKAKRYNDTYSQNLCLYERKQRFQRKMFITRIPL